MASKKTAPRKTPATRAETGKGAAHSTVSGPARGRTEDASTGTDALNGEGAVPRLVGVRLGRVATQQGGGLDRRRDGRDHAGRAVRRAGGAWRQDAAQAMALWGRAQEFVKEQYRHCKPMFVLGAARVTVEGTGVPLKLPTGEEDPGLLVQEDGDADAAMDSFVAAIAAHRRCARFADPPPV